MNGILGLDPANHTGYAHSDGFRGVLPIGSRFDRFPGQRLIRLRDWLRETLAIHRTQLIAAEDASFGSPNPSVQAQHNELRGVIQMVAAEYSISVKLFAPSTIKAFAAGHGHATKADMIRAVKRHWGIDVLSDDEADAIAIMHLAQRPDCWPNGGAKAVRKAKKQQAAKTARLF